VIAKKIYRFLKWYFIAIKSLGKSTKVIYINPQDIKYGQLPESQFPVQDTYKFVQGGDWDKAVLPVTDHMLYRSYVEHFSKNVPWDKTPIYKMAVDKIEKGEKFRGEYGDVDALNIRFNKCDELYAKIKVSGFKSNHELYKEKKISNILSCLDEVTVNISRDGELLFNDGWHRLVSARLLDVPTMPVRVLMKHAKAKQLSKLI
jgi:hypothetical protein